MAQTTADLDRVRSEMAWEQERNAIAHSKLRNHFLDGIQDTRFVVKAFKSRDQVSTFRCPQASLEFKRRASRLSMAESARPQDSIAVFKSSMRPSTVMSDIEEQSDPSMLHTITETLGGRGRHMAEALKAQQRKIKRRERQERWEALMSTKPDPSSADPEDILAIRNAEENMGDYRLKTSVDYVVPLEEHVNTSRKRDQLVALRQRMFDCKSTFNGLVVRLRTRKQSVIEQVLIDFILCI
jgi:hypothetical protein